MSITKIATVTIGAGGAASIDIQSIPGTFTDLMLVVSSRNATSGPEHCLIGVNGSTANFTGRYLIGSTNAETGTYARYLGNQMPTSAAANTFSSAQVYIPNYTASTNKPISSEIIGYRTDRSSFTAGIASNLWSQSGAITSIQITNESSANLAQYSSATLYGITKGSLAGVTVS